MFTLRGKINFTNDIFYPLYTSYPLYFPLVPNLPTCPPTLFQTNTWILQQISFFFYCLVYSCISIPARDANTFRDTTRDPEAYRIEDLRRNSVRFARSTRFPGSVLSVLPGPQALLVVGLCFLGQRWLSFFVSLSNLPIVSMSNFLYQYICPLVLFPNFYFLQFFSFFYILSQFLYVDISFFIFYFVKISFFCYFSFILFLIFYSICKHFC